MSALSILHVTDDLHPASGGPSRTVSHLADALAYQPGMAVTLLTQSLVGAPTVASANPALVRRVESSAGLALKLGNPVRRVLASWSPMNRPALLHGHGLWSAVNHWTARVARHWNVPLVVHPRGMLEPWAIEHRGWKKQLALALYQWRDLDTARVLVATAEQEFINLRALGLRQPIAIIPNGVSLPATDGVLTRPPRPAGALRTLLFLSRVQAKKGLLNLIDALGYLKPSGWRLQIAGPVEDGHLAEVLTRARQVGVSDLVEYVGIVDGGAKSVLYFGADLFVLPTFSENFGVAVAEALAHGLPVITTKGAPWADLEAYDCGWWIDIGVDPLANALGQAMALTDAERQTMGARGREYVRRFDWSDIARQTAEVYRWVLARGPLPACVRLD